MRNRKDEFVTGFWKNKRVLLTGHTGFKGAWLSLWLQKMGANVCGLALAPEAGPNLFSMAEVAKGMDSRIGDIRNAALVAQVMCDFKPEIVLHLAAQALVKYSYDNPLETYATNVMGTAHVLDAVRKVDTVRSVVVVTTDKCYENKEWHWGYREVDPMGGYDPYSSSKGCAELVTAAYRRSYFHPEKHAQHGVGIASARAGNVIGGGDWAVDRLVPDIIRAYLRGETVRIRSPYAIRPWQHVLEPLSGYLTIAEKLFVEGVAFADGFNFGPTDEDCKSVEVMVSELTRLWGEGANWELDSNPHPHEASFLKLDSSKARAELGWSPRWRLARALEETMQWYRRAAQEPARSRTLCLEQISAYEES